jgi:tetratricopeptide (TPR) repeat protein
MLEDLLSDPAAPPETYLYLGRALHALGEFPRALAALTDYVRLKPKNPQGYFFSGRTLLAMGENHRAAGALIKALKLHPRNIQIMALLGIAYLKSHHSAQAVSTLEEAVETAAARNIPSPEQQRIYHAYINALIIRGIKLCRQENYELGVQMLCFVKDNGASLPLLHLELGRACREMGRLEESLDHYAEALALAPKDRRIRWFHTSILMALGRSSEALKEIDEIRESNKLLGDPSVPELPWNSGTVDLYLARSFMERGEWRRAADACKALLKRLTKDQSFTRALGPLHAMYAEALRNLGDFPAALNHLALAQKIDNDRLEYQYERWICAWEGEDQKALQKAIAHLKALNGDQNLIGLFEIMYWARYDEDDQKVIALLQSGIRGQGPNPDLMYYLGERYLKIGLPDLALSWFRKTREVLETQETLPRDKAGVLERSILGEIAALQALAAEEEPGAADSPHRETVKDLGGAFERYLHRWPDNYAIRREWALLLVRRKNYALAVKELEALLARAPGNPSLRRLLASVYQKLGRSREALVFQPKTGYN